MDGDIRKVLTKSSQVILSYLKRIISDNNFNYRTFGVDIEPYISDILINIFTKNGYIKDKNDYKIALNKNDFPDFELKKSPKLAIEYKSGNVVKLSKGRWVRCKNSNNDMGTFNSWPAKIKNFGSENIYYIFIVYRFDSRTQNIINIQIAPFYKFIGLNSDKLLKYREKDGNLRPKDFYGKSPIKSYKQFKNLFDKTIKYRSRRIIKKHQKILESLNAKK